MEDAAQSPCWQQDFGMHVSIRASSSCMFWNKGVEWSQKGLCRREWWVFGRGSSQMGFRRDLFFISVRLVGFSDSVSPGSTHLWHFVLVSVCEGGEEKNERMERERERASDVSKMRTHGWLRCLMSWLHIRNRRRFSWLMNLPPAPVNIQTLAKTPFFFWTGSCFCIKPLENILMVCVIAVCIQLILSGNKVQLNKQTICISRIRLLKINFPSSNSHSRCSLFGSGGAAKSSFSASWIFFPTLQWLKECKVCSNTLYWLLASLRRVWGSSVPE